jgi:hypothetical protein
MIIYCINRSLPKSILLARAFNKHHMKLAISVMQKPNSRRRAIQELKRLMEGEGVQKGGSHEFN